jgi:hypothetical protein
VMETQSGSYHNLAGFAASEVEVSKRMRRLQIPVASPSPTPNQLLLPFIHSSGLEGLFYSIANDHHSSYYVPATYVVVSSNLCAAD